MSPKSLLLSLFALVLVLCFCPIDLVSYHLTKKTVFDAGHFPLFFVFSFGLALFVKLSRPALWQEKWRLILLGILLFATSFAAVIELIQPIFDRSRELDDFIVGSLGAAFGIYGAAVFLRATSFRQKFFFCCYTSLLGLFLLRNLPFAYEADNLEKAQFPLLGSFEDIHELEFWEPVPDFRQDLATVEAEHATQGEYSFRIVPRPQGSMGIRYHIGHQDWSGFHKVVMDIYLEGEPTVVYYNLESKQGWPKKKLQSETEFRIQSGSNHLEIPLSAFEKANLSAVSRLTILLGIEQIPTRSIYVDAVRLE